VRIFSKDNYAAVTGTLALVVALGGTSYAATQLAKNSVGSAQIKNGAVATVDLHKNAVNGSKVKDNSLTGNDINESKLGTVPNSAHIDGNIVTKINYKKPASTAETIIYKVGGLLLHASCTSTPSPTITATTTVDNSSIYSVAVFDGDPNNPLENDLESGAFDSTTAPFDLLDGSDGNIDVVTFEYDNPNNVVITGTLVVDERIGTPACTITGDVIAG
jgi:hypothetical protein